jgi:hypothetical protein
MTAPWGQPHIGLVVEGAGDHGAVPMLLRRHLHDAGEFREILGKPIPAHGRDKALREKGLEGFVATAAARPGCVAVLVVLDGEGDCVAQLGPTLLARGRSVTGKEVSVALADVDYESWLFASAETLDLSLTFDSTRRGQHEIVTALRPAKYVKPTWQPRLTSRMDMSLARSRNTSFDRLLTRFDQLREVVQPLL